MKYFFYISAITLLISCAHKSSTDEVKRFKEQFQSDKFSVRGDYHWNFQLMGDTQHSVHTFYEDSISYSMKGKVYSTHYSMFKLSFNETNNKWIGRDEDGIVYVLFFKDKTDSTLTIYKHKCKNNGVEEAIKFDLPPPNATEDHGWNVYTLGKDDEIDRLAIQGHFTNGEHTINIEDRQILYDNKSFSKLSYHEGERRWVGRKDSSFLQVFFKDLNGGGELLLSAKVHNDLEKAYQIKFREVSFLKYARDEE